MNICYTCKKTRVLPLLDLGNQPISNRFLVKNENEFVHSMKLNQCQDCALVQINDPVPAEKLLPLFDWITYSEPEGHLDELVENILKLPGINKQSAFLGISFKDDSTLKRIEDKGYLKTWRLDLQKDLGIKAKQAGAETIQMHLTVSQAKKIGEARDKADVVIVRHIFEHVHNMEEFCQALKELTTSQGYIIFEVPDCTKALKELDYTTVWEEHTCYFTPFTFQNCFSALGFVVKDFKLYPYPFENSLIAVTQAAPTKKDSELSREQLQEELNIGKLFGSQFVSHKQKIRQFIQELREEYGPIAVFGAGHLACVYVNFFGIQDLIEFFVDDNPNKIHLLMPGSKLPIYGSKAILENKIKVCILGLNPLSEDKVVSRNQAFVESGGKFFSIFPGSKYALPIDLRGAYAA